MEQLIEQTIAGLGYELVDLERAANGLIRVFMDDAKHERDITVEDCEAASRQLTYVFEVENVNYERLEVSSPGVDRPLTRLKDFDLFEGFEARLESDRMIEGRKRFKGIVAGTEGENVCMDLDGEDDTALIPFDWLVDAKLVMTDALLKRGAEIRARRGEPEDDGLPEGATEDQTDTKTQSEDKA